MLLAGRVGVSVMKSLAFKRCVYIAGRKTSVSLEDDFWNSLREIADKRGQTLPHLIATIDAKRKSANLSSNLRLFVLGYYQDQYNSSGKHVEAQTLQTSLAGAPEPTLVRYQSSSPTNEAVGARRLGPWRWRPRLD
jgi:predicted DNA-binding ribbon-helix-helix protein